jgi:hypothetical protein
VCGFLTMLQGGGAAEGQETEAFYSPLRSGASQISFKSVSPGTRSPRPLMRSASGPLVPDEDGTPRSPWAITHERVFTTLDVGESDSPLRHGARQSPLLHGAAQRSPRSPGQRGGGYASWAGPTATETTSQVQRLPRRVVQSSSGDAVGDRDADGNSPAARSQPSSPARRRMQQATASPGVMHRYPPDADADSPMASPGRQPRSPGCPVRGAGHGVHDSRDLSIEGAEAVRPVGASQLSSEAVRSSIHTLRASLKKLE